LCHTCGSKANIYKNCPECNNHNLIYKNPGTKQIEANLKKIFPLAKIGRYDKDNTKTETFSAMHSDIMSGKVDILVGTQLLSKGHDLPKLTLVGILNADSGLQIPDYSSSEKNFQILQQIIGRVGRGHLPGEVVIQSYGDKNKLSNLIEQNNYTWQKFYEIELKNRKAFNYPPYCFILKVEISRKNEDNLVKNISEFSIKIAKKHPNVEIIGPAPSLISKRNNNHYWQIIIKSKNRSVLKEIISDLPNNCSYDLDPINLI
jgi:primosomal protein N' (replication factor Y)